MKVTAGNYAATGIYRLLFLGQNCLIKQDCIVYCLRRVEFTVELLLTFPTGVKSPIMPISYRMQEELLG